MTVNRDFDRIARAWLDLMPDEAPERSIAAVLQAVEGTPQIGRGLGVFAGRPFMNRISILAAAAAVIIVVAGAVLLLRPSSNVGPPVSPTPSLSASVGAVGVPEPLRYAWLGDRRDVPELPTDRSVLEFTETQLSYIQEVSSTVVSPAAGQLFLTLVSAPARTGCQAGDIGTYAYTLSPGGTKLAIDVVEEECPERGAAVAGDWLRSECLNLENWCLGQLEAGEYASYFISPKLEADTEWSPEFGAIRYTVPDGWAAASDFPREYFLEPAEWYAENHGDFATETRGIYVGSHVAVLAPGRTCAPGLAEDVGRSTDAITSWLAEHPALDAEQPVPVAIDGVQGAYVDGMLDPGADEICRPAPTPVALLFGEDGMPADGRLWGALEGQRVRWIVLDLAPGQPLLIMITARDELFDELLAEAMPIVESFEFE